MEIECKFGYFVGTSKVESETKYACIVESANIVKPYTRIKAFKGHHKFLKSNKNVKYVIFKNTSVHFIPKDLHIHFPKIESLVIDNCGLKEISRRELMGLGNLEMLQVTSNPISTLPEDLFVDTTKLYIVDFKGNQIECLSSKLLAPIIKNHLYLIDFTDNARLNTVYTIAEDFSSWEESAYFAKTITELMTIMDTRSKLPREPCYEKESIIQVFSELWSHKHWADAVIVVGAKEFQVHKVVLASQSSILKAMLLNEMQGNRLVIEGHDPLAIEEFLKYLYTGQEPKVDEAIKVFHLAAKFAIDRLKAICATIIGENLCETNVLDAHDIGCTYNKNNLKLAALEKISSMFNIDLSDKIMNCPKHLREMIEPKVELRKAEKARLQAKRVFELFEQAPEIS